VDRTKTAHRTRRGVDREAGKEARVDSEVNLKQGFPNLAPTDVHKTFKKAKGKIATQVRRKHRGEETGVNGIARKEPKKDKVKKQKKCRIGGLITEQ